MKIYIITILLWFPAVLFAQDTLALKRQAENMAKAMVNGNYSTVISYMYPKAVEYAGGKQKLLQMMNNSTDQLKAQGIFIQSILFGPPGRFYRAGAELHCLLPQNMRIKTPNSSMVAHSNLLAVSKNGGKSWVFLDLNKNTILQIPKMFPHFNKALKIPPPSMPLM